VNSDAEVEAAGVLSKSLILRRLVFDFDNRCGFEVAEVLQSGMVENDFVVGLNTGSTLNNSAMVWKDQ
jgi:hypothetical protein